MGRFSWKLVCEAAEAIGTGAPEALFSRTLEQLDLLMPFDHAVAVPNMDAQEVRNRIGRPNTRMTTVRSPPGYWESYLEYYEALDPNQNKEHYLGLQEVTLSDRSSQFGTEFGRDFLQKFGVRYCLCLSNLPLTGGRGFLVGLFRGGRIPFSQAEMALASALFPHVNNFSRIVENPDGARVARAHVAAAAAGLSPREQDVAVLLSERMSIIEIADRLFISRHTVAKHMQHIYWKLQADGKRDVRRLLLGELAQ